MKKLYIGFFYLLLIFQLYSQDTLQYRFGFMQPELAGAVQSGLDVHWARLHPGPFVWNRIEPVKGKFDFREIDREVEIMKDYDIDIIATIWPFADWDQNMCHSKCTEEILFDELGMYRQKPCNMEDYKNFLTKLVERYDGDGIDDMQNLGKPIKYWEIINEPEIRPAWFFCGTSGEYLEILRESYLAIKAADPEAFVLNGGTMGTMPEALNYWQKIIDGGGSQYIDIFTYHQIGGDTTANTIEINTFLQNNFINKPLWLTELGLKEDLFPPGYKPSEIDMGTVEVKTHINAFAGGVQKIFSIGISKPPDTKPPLLSIPGSILKSHSVTKDDKMILLFVYQTMVSQLDRFESVQQLSQNFFKFKLPDNHIFVYWNQPPDDPELDDTLLVTDIIGNTRMSLKSDLKMTKSPLYLKNAVFDWTEVVPGKGAGIGDDPNRDGPWKHRIVSASSSDGLYWTKDTTIVADQASVPDAMIDKEGKVRVYYVDYYNQCMTVAIQQNDLSFRYFKVIIDGSADMRTVDPDVLFMPDGKYGLYFFDQRVKSLKPEDPRVISLAVSEDGVVFFTVQDTCYAESFITDPDVVRLNNGKFHMFVSIDGNPLGSCISDDGMKFMKQGNIDLHGNSGSINQGTTVRVYYHKHDGQRLSIYSAVNPDPEDITGWTDEGIRIQAGVSGNIDILGAADPSPIKMPDGSYKMYYKTFIGEDNTFIEQKIASSDSSFILTAYPNPFNSIVTIRYYLPHIFKKQKLYIIDSTGRLVRTFELTESNGEICWNCTDNANRLIGNGVYLFGIKGHSLFRKMVLIK
jgi:hypothetical protein